MGKLVCLFAFALLFVAGCSDSATQAPERAPEDQRQVNDAELAVAVKRQLMEDRVPGAGGLNVDARNGAVTVNGHTGAPGATDKIRVSAMKVPGVKVVTVNLKP